MVKVDIESGYRIEPVHPENIILIGMWWKDKLHIDTALPFGHCSAPKIFKVKAGAVH